MSRRKPCAPNDTYDVSLSNEIKANVKEEVIELLMKDKRTCNAVTSNMEEDRDVNDESRVFGSRCITG